LTPGSTKKTKFLKKASSSVAVSFPFGVAAPFLKIGVGCS
jgi:hypothetical protein